MVDRQLNYGREMIRRFTAGLDVATALDLGAGMGEDLDTIAALHPGARIAAVEAHPPYASQIRARGFEVFALDIERDRLPFDDGAVDLIVANQILEHVKEIFWVLHECSRVLRIGGSLVVGVPNIAALHNRFLLGIGRQPTQLSNASAHVRGYTRPDLIATVDRPFRGGYRVVEVAGANFYPLPGWMAKPAARIWPGGAWGLFVRFEKTTPYAGSYLRWPVENALETVFYLGDPGS